MKYGVDRAPVIVEHPAPYDPGDDPRNRPGQQHQRLHYRTAAKGAMQRRSEIIAREVVNTTVMTVKSSVTRHAARKFSLLITAA